MKKRLHLLISGLVQGVYYRGSAVETGRRLHLTGWVRNRHDGRVELVAEGEEASLQALLDWCWQGPTMAQVEDIEAQWLACEEAYPDFRQTPTPHA